jgi:hypothetical protein
MTLTRKELFAERLDEIGDFWRVCQEFATEGWAFSDFEDAGVVQDLYSFNYLRNMLLAPRHRNISAFFEWLREALKDRRFLTLRPGARRGSMTWRTVFPLLPGTTTRFRKVD